ncbi:MAG: acyltransferase family protein [Dehalococcoidia bacterium]
MKESDLLENKRYNGLDALRAMAMFSGILLHGSITYFSQLFSMESIWPTDSDQSLNLALLFDFIHTWRMPTFFLLAGFFAHMVIERRHFFYFFRDRLKRILLPLLIFGPIMALLLPTIWLYGWKGYFSFRLVQEVIQNTNDLGSSGELIGHLWFLYYLSIMYFSLGIICFFTKSKYSLILLLFTWIGFLLLLAYVYGFGPFNGISTLSAIGLIIFGFLIASFITVTITLTSLIKFLFLSRLGIIFTKTIYSRIPILFVIAACLILGFRAGNESKPIWPINAPDFLYSSLFFLYGYGLWANRSLIDRLKGSSYLVLLCLSAFIFYVSHLVCVTIMDSLNLRNDLASIQLFEFLNLICYGSSAVLITLALIGVFEASMNSSRKWVRWLSDSSYWIYIIHLPLVSLTTFYLGHMDRNQWLKKLTGIEWNAESKFLISCIFTMVVCLVTYRCLVRYTPIGLLLNGRRSRSP